MLGDDLTTNGTTTTGVGGWKCVRLSPLNPYKDLTDESAADPDPANRGNSVMTALLRR